MMIDNDDDNSKSYDDNNTVALPNYLSTIPVAIFFLKKKKLHADG